MARTYGVIKFIENREYKRFGTYGDTVFDERPMWEISQAEPHVSIKLKNVFPKISKTAVPPYYFLFNAESCHDLDWFMQRYPLAISPHDMRRMQKGKQNHISYVNEMETILLPNYKPGIQKLIDGQEARPYQVVAKDVWHKSKRILIGDEMGLGKTLAATLLLLEKKTLPGVVVMQAHLPHQWRAEIEKFTSLNIHYVNTTKPYNLPPADVYFFKYSNIAGWVNIFDKQLFKTVIFDEVQELRRKESKKYDAAKVLSDNAEFVTGLSGTPIYNFGDEIFNIMNVIKKGCLGDEKEFLREWTLNGKHVTDPKALGAYLRENFLFLRRTRVEVGRELPVVNKIIQTVPYDEDEVEKSKDIAKMLALQVLNGASFMERGQAARELDVYLRQQTGVAKARYVAEFVKILLDNKEPVLLSGWHRAVYDIWMKELFAYNPVMYTGSESPKQKNEALRKFASGESEVFIISNRSGIGLNGLQYRCRTVVIGELDWSPKVHDQIITRVDRDGQPEQVTAFFPVCDFGSDPIIIDLLGEKASQSHNIIDPFMGIADVHSDDSRIKVLAQKYLASIN